MIKFLSRLFGQKNKLSETKKHKRTHAQPVSQATTPPRRTEEVKRAHSLTELPAFTDILTREGGEIPATDESRELVAALLVAPYRVVIVLNGDGALTSNSLKSLRSSLRLKAYQVGTVYILSNVLFSQLTKGEEDSHVEGIDSANSVQLFDQICEKGISLGATDIHIGVREESARAYYRINSRISDAENDFLLLKPDAAIAAIGVAYNKLAVETSRSKAETQFSPTRNQYCMIDRQILGKQYRLRYQSVRAEGGFDVIMRVLHSESVAQPKSLPELGYARSHVKEMEIAMTRAVGAIFIAGMTGSGKSTTLMTLMMMNKDRRQYKSYSVEDPVEYRMFGITQMPIQRDTSAAEDSSQFSEAIRVLMRADPDNITIGEIRDRDTAEVFAPAVQSGHRVFTTVHASSAVGIIERLTSAPIHMPAAVLSSKKFISFLMFQALLPKLCPKCSKPARGTLSNEYLEMIENKFSVDCSGMRAKGNGCSHCKNGYHGQSVIAEVLLPDTKFLMLIRDGKTIEAEQYWRSKRKAGFADEDMTGKTALEHGLWKSLQGIFDPRDVETACDAFESYEIIEVKNVN